MNCQQKVSSPGASQIEAAAAKKVLFSAQFNWQKRIKKVFAHTVDGSEDAGADGAGTGGGSNDGRKRVTGVSISLEQVKFVRPGR